MKILIIGGTRFVGHHLALELLARGHAVTILNRGRTQDELPAHVERLRADRTVPGALRGALGSRSFDGVVDMVAYRGVESHDAVEALQDRTGHYVHISSGQVYLVLEPRPPEPCREEDFPGSVMPPPPAGTREHAEWLYGVEKRECEEVLRRAREERGFPATILRLPMVNGERDSYYRVDAYVARVQDGGPLLVPAETGRLLRHVYQADVVRTVRMLLETGRGLGGAFNLSQDQTLELDEFLDLIASELGRPLRRRKLPRAILEAESLLPACSPFSERWMSVIDNARATHELGCRFTTPREYLPSVVAACRGTSPERIPGYELRPRELALAGRHA